MKKELRTDGKRGGAPIAVEAREQGQAAKAPARPIRSYGDLRALQPAHLAVFSQAVRAGTFSETAKVLGLTQSAVSQTIERLEAQLGLTLFDRTSRPAELTSQGREVFKLAVGLLEEAERFLEAVEGLRAGEVRSLRFGITEVAGSYASAALEAALIPRVDAFEASGGLIPKVLDDFGKGRLDVVVAPDIPADRRLIAFELMREDYLIVCPKAAAAKDFLPVEVLLERLRLPFVSYRHESLDWRRSQGMLRMLGVAPHDAISLENTQAVASAVSAGFGWTILTPTSLWCVRHALDRVSVHSIGAVSIEKTLWAAAGAQRFRALALEAARVFRTRFETDWLPELLARKPELGRFVRASALPLPAA